VRIRQAYLLRGPVTARVRVTDGAGARITVKAPRAAGGRFEWELPVPAALGRALLRLSLPRIEKTRLRAGRLEIDRLTWPPGIVLVELELRPEEGLDLRDPTARARLALAHRPDWVQAWQDVTNDPLYTNARLARRPPLTR
jgi:CYTH domain-containing protein